MSATVLATIGYEEPARTAGTVCGRDQISSEPAVAVTSAAAAVAVVVTELLSSDPSASYPP